MPRAREAFDNPEEHWSFLTAEDDSSVESQHFDRKEVPGHSGTGISKSQLSQMRDHVRECVSAFANENREGGLLVLGIGTDGAVTGVEHLDEGQLNSLANVQNLLLNQAAVPKVVDFADRGGSVHKILMILAPFTPGAICHAPGPREDAWVRQGAQNVPVDQLRRQQLIFEKGIRSYEDQVCCPYDAAEVDSSVIEEYRRAVLSDATLAYTDEEVLYQAGALARRDGQLHFTNAGLLFFAANPQRMMPNACVRLLRYESDHDASVPPSTDTLDKTFAGSLTAQIRGVRAFVEESGLFKTYTVRDPNGGFNQEPELPFIAVDEGVVNALAHRDYSVSSPVLCKRYRDAFTVENPGRIVQPERDVPQGFSLDTVELDSAPRNPKLMTWLRQVRDERGRAFVRQLSEGTRRMQAEMARMSLPAPEYRVTPARTTVTLLNDAARREALLGSEQTPETTGFTNLYPLHGRRERGLAANAGQDERRQILQALEDGLRGLRWMIHGHAFGRLTASPRGARVALPADVGRIVGLYPAYALQVREYFGQLYLAVDYRLEVHCLYTAQALEAASFKETLVGRTATIRSAGKFERAKILSLDAGVARVRLLDSGTETVVSASQVWPDLPTTWIQQVLQGAGIGFDLEGAIKIGSLASQRNAARLRAERTQAAVELMTEQILALSTGPMTALTIDRRPAPLVRGVVNGKGSGLPVSSLPEPAVEFKNRHESANIRDGITSFGSYGDEPRTIELVPICTPDRRHDMARLIQRLQAGSRRYRGVERTFSSRLTYQSVVTAETQLDVVEECRRLLRDHPEWVAAAEVDRLFLILTPEHGYASDDERSPYFTAKRLLLESGMPCQMVDTPTLDNPDFKDLNLALNITAKCGVTPWVFPDAIPDADFFIGLSYTESQRDGGSRLLGYANVFNSFGRWEFYSGNTEAFPYEERAQRFGELVRLTLSRLSLSETPSIHFHYSAKFSREDRDAILQGCRAVKPHGRYSFVWVNQHHNLRLYDSRPDTDGSLSRGSYVRTSRNQLLLSTTGDNQYRRALGTPKPLELTVWAEGPGARRQDADLRSLASQVLALTKLNWASTDSLCAEPITIKYAHDIAYLTSAFMRQASGPFRLHPRLERTPWFI